ncbi:MAG: YihY/virulence factor BrkB family protein, partial [Actinomycetes bacterium]
MSRLSARKATRRRPEPDADVKPDSLRQISRRSWRYLLRRTLREFWRDECPDLAAGLTYYAVLAVVPGLIALLSVLGLVGEGPQGYAMLLDVAGRVVPASGLDVVLPILQRLSASPRAGLALVLSLLLAVWFVSAYLGAFGRAMNRIYAVPEGRPLWKLQPLLMALTVVFGLGAVVITLLVVLSGPLAEAVGAVLGLGSALILLWEIAKWPLLLAVVVLLVALLYYLTPNLRQPRFHWLSPGAVLAIVTWMVGSALFGLYVTTFAGYSAAYGSLAGVIVFLVW